MKKERITPALIADLCGGLDDLAIDQALSAYTPPEPQKGLQEGAAKAEQAAAKTKDEKRITRAISDAVALADAEFFFEEYDRAKEFPAPADFDYKKYAARLAIAACRAEPRWLYFCEVLEAMEGTLVADLELPEGKQQ